MSAMKSVAYLTEIPGNDADQALNDQGVTPDTVDGVGVFGEPMSREQRRSRRKRVVRARTISVKRMTKRELDVGRTLFPEMDYWKPQARVECGEGMRPCPFVSCKHHLYIDVSAKTGAIKLNFPDLEVWEMTESCALDVADRGGTTLEDVGAIMNLTRERIRQVEVKALAKLEALSDMECIRELIDEGPVGKRRLPVLSRNELDGVRAPRAGAAPAAEPVSDVDLDEEEVEAERDQVAAEEVLPSVIFA